MFIGHFGLAFGAKKAAPAVSLGSLFLACQFADLLWPTLVLLGIERTGDQEIRGIFLSWKIQLLTSCSFVFSWWPFRRSRSADGKEGSAR
jgi:hypothetical protein